MDKERIQNALWAALAGFVGALFGINIPINF